MDHGIVVAVGNRGAEDHNSLGQRPVRCFFLLGRLVVAERFGGLLYFIYGLLPEGDVFLFTQDHGDGGLGDAGVLRDISGRDFVSFSHLSIPLNIS